MRSVSLKENAKATLIGFNSRAGIDFNISGVSTLDFPEMIAGDLNFTVSDESTVTGNISAGDVVLDISGTSDILLAGSGSILNCKASGASKIQLDDLFMDNAIVRLRGASSCTINAAVKVDIDLGGSSDLYYYGNPVMGKTKISDDSKMTKK